MLTRSLQSNIRTYFRWRVNEFLTCSLVFFLLSSIFLYHKHLVHPFTCLTRPLAPLFTRFLFAIIYYPFSQASCPLVHFVHSSTCPLNNLQILSNVCRIGKNWSELERLITWNIIYNYYFNSEFIIHNYDYRYSDSSKLKG